MLMLWQDIRFGVRMLLKNWSFTLVVVLSLAFGIGANTAIFTVVNSVLIRPLAYRDPGRIVAVPGTGAVRVRPRSPWSSARSKVRTVRGPRSSRVSR